MLLGKYMALDREVVDEIIVAFGQEVGDISIWRPILEFEQHGRSLRAKANIRFYLWESMDLKKNFREIFLSPPPHP